jgi:NAD(P)-dependent dehydrogenase (short-subunit alcohol dehydrogenase family)
MTSARRGEDGTGAPPRVGNFNRRSTAEQVSAGVDLAGRHAIVTGANAGIGFETARVLALRGCSVTMACRDLTKAARARGQLIAGAKSRVAPASVDIMRLDLARFESIRSFANEGLSTDRPIHLMINKAGVMLPDRRLTADGFEHHFGINHLGHYLLTNLLLDRLVQSAPARVVVVSSDAMQFAALDAGLEDLNWEKRRYSGWRSYGSSKLMNALFANELQRRHGERGVVANALHPGIVQTELGRDQPWYMALIGLAMLPVMKSPARGAATTLLLATSPELETQGGGYYADCGPNRVHPLALDVDVAARLWAGSEELVGLA